MPKNWSLRLMSLLVLVVTLIGCGGGGGGSSDSDTTSLQGTWSANNVVLHNSSTPAWSETYTNFKLNIGSEQITASADDGYWNWGPATYSLDGTHLTVSNIPEQEGGDTVLLTLDLQQNDGSLAGTVRIDWWVSTTNSYFTGIGNVAFAK